MNYFGVDREVRAVDDITMTVRKNEVYGIAGESSSGKTSFIKVLAAAIRPPLRVVAGIGRRMTSDGDGRRDRGTQGGDRRDPLAHISLHHAGLDERAQSGAPDRPDLRGFRRAAARAAGQAFWDRVIEHLSG